MIVACVCYVACLLGAAALFYIVLPTVVLPSRSGGLAPFISYVDHGGDLGLFTRWTGLALLRQSYSNGPMSRGHWMAAALFPEVVLHPNHRSGLHARAT